LYFVGDVVIDATAKLIENGKLNVDLGAKAVISTDIKGDINKVVDQIKGGDR
jgi:hypothetical protein